VPQSTATERHVLVIAPQWVGDAILSLPLIRQLAQEYKAVDVLAVPAVQAVYQACPEVRQLHVEQFQHGKLQLGLRRKVAQRFKGLYETAIVCPNSLKSALIPWLAAIPIRRGTTGESRYWLINDRRDPKQQGMGKRPSMLQTYLGFADRPLPASQIDGFGAHRPVLQVSGTVPDTVHLVLCPGAEYGPAKQWPTAYFAEVARHWLGKSPAHSVSLIGGPKDVALGNQIETMITLDTPAFRQRVFNRCGKTSLQEAFEAIAKAGCVISNDSGLMHAAAALDIPVIALFGSTDPHHTPPHSKKATVLSLGLSCSPCFQRDCPLGTTACLKDLGPDRVINVLAGARAARP
jgi:heptosyltransferase II